MLDPACGSGNFLYVALEQMKRLEGEVTDLLEELGAGQGLRGLAGVTVDPHQFLGIELNPWAAAVAELVLWIGYLQWHFRTHGHATPSQPVLKDFHNIECRDAVLKWQNIAPRVDERNQPITRWDGVTTITHPITGEQVPDPSAQVPVVNYQSAERADWPEADFIVGNPPFIGNRRMRDELGDGYVDALRSVSHKSLADADFVMFWWDKAAQLLVTPKTKLRCFGLIATNSLSQTKNRAVISRRLSGKPVISFVYVIRDHPWVDAQDGASVRVAMGVCRAGKHEGKLATVVSEVATDDESVGYAVQLRVDEGKIWSNLRLGPDLDSVRPLAANRELSWQGCKLVGARFQITPGKRRDFVEANPATEQHLPQYLAGSDITKVARLRYVVDLTGLSLRQATKQLPELVQYLTDHVKPARDHSTDKGFREKWWLFGRRRPEMRAALSGLKSYFATSEVAKHRFFVRFDWPSQLVDGSVIVIAHDDLSIFALLHSTHHKVWTLAMAGTLEDRPRYQNEVSFDPFPFPELSEGRRTRLRELANRLDEHRRARQQMHPKLTLTQMYNVLEKVRTGEAFVGRDKDIYDKGLIGILKQLHDEIDEDTAEAYGWPADLSGDEVLFRLVELNTQRAEEERQGLIRWLRPEYQNPEGKRAEAEATSGTLALGDAPEKADKPAWPPTLPEQIAGVREALQVLGEASPQQVARHFKRGRAKTVEPLLETLAALGQARKLDDGRFAC